MHIFSGYIWNLKPSFAFLSTHLVPDQRLKALEKQVPPRQAEPLLDQEQWRALKEICKTT